MSDLSKYEIFIQELTSVEVQVSALRELYEELKSRNKELEKKLSNLQKENEYLKMQIESGEDSADRKAEGIGEKVFGSLSVNEREDLKVKISDVITKINDHLTSS
ncbi:MAG: hypothetical protein COZ80_06170 [Ignavibacteria bacterium CG_4_8_14_3_um_filter_37_9]|nr:hypothetical protein [Ignavibacteria bacterium]OIO17879.1 MAG: hypothetical protein AUJ54_09180 [Ignavibacteria bacterium CG1_02_37_35]PIP78568.1 MAG: hypothetical protein COW85_03730 [Ignavibacteria bacterium CG22_combo_CG10-13_8_21_14_all_37_15]PIS45424.1 MAG: hypothetical protein COT22_05330 [Ignavibacteria bacterium CG08_land_8_20_14_0_20_37_9]PIW99291.1 MAG: hypothetical protein COZ80_06170 [Ignavibacteria bacterium CG_4_8_14_3_um_filter_37_9]PIX94324.1 MAG: hypothetical protein COZ25_